VDQFSLFHRLKKSIGSHMDSMRRRIAAPYLAPISGRLMLEETSGKGSVLVSPIAVKVASDYQINFRANWISLAVVVVEVSKPATPVAAPVESKMSVLLGLTGTEKFA
jgi:hypothetical protein